MTYTLGEIDIMIEKFYVKYLYRMMSEDIDYNPSSIYDSIFVNSVDNDTITFKDYKFREEVFREVLPILMELIKPELCSPICIWKMLNITGSRHHCGDENRWYRFATDCIEIYCINWFKENIQNACVEMGDLCKFDRRIVPLEQMAKDVFYWKYMLESDFGLNWRERPDFASNIWRMGKKMAMKNELKNILPIEIVDNIMVHNQQDDNNEDNRIVFLENDEEGVYNVVPAHFLEDDDAVYFPADFNW